MVKEYLDWLIDESSSSSDDVVEATAQVVEATAEVVEAPVVVASSSDDVGLFGGGGDVIPTTTSSSSTTDSNTETFTYQPSLRTNLGSTILLSGTVDPTLLSILNNNFFGQDLVPNFEFTTIKALVKDVGKAKKGAISREARYGGLLDKLVIEEKSSSNNDDDVLPTMEELEGVSSWIVQLSLTNDISTKLSQIGKLAKESSSVTNVVVLVEGMSCTLNTVDGWEKVLEDSSNSNNGEEEENYKCTLLAVGELYDGVNDGGYYHIGPLDKSGIENMDNKVDIIDAPKLSKKKAYQLLAHSLSLDSTVSQSLIAYEYPSVALNAITQPYAEGEFVNRDEEGNEKEDTYKNVKMEGRMIQAMREMGFTQYMELDVLVGKGLESYKEYLANPPNKENAFASASSKSKRDEIDEKIMAQLEKESAERKAIQDVKDAEQRSIDIEGIAKEWVTREYTLRMLNGDIDDSVSEKDFMVSVWDEALVEGEKAYEYIKSDEYAKEKEAKAKAESVENKLFWDGMPDDMRLMREKMIEKVKKQYMDLLSEEELERIILSE